MVNMLKCMAVGIAQVFTYAKASVTVFRKLVSQSHGRTLTSVSLLIIEAMVISFGPLTLPSTSVRDLPTWHSISISRRDSWDTNIRGVPNLATNVYHVGGSFSQGFRRSARSTPVPLHHGAANQRWTGEFLPLYFRNPLHHR